ncbi:ABC transporter ATP-binding protein [Chthonobacter rhizosphaerae]|uniref:ABC transporter ATP-binding protein n=1 Tax=Chthonobacter rhizosphaerae TaxID=2735553 RepID=UPI0015EEE96D|nr:ABC transporter ATP-binding protein [Chthonobacter rhizosphaerae]
MSRDVKLDRVTMRFGDFTAVDDVSLDIRAGEFFSFLGPSGCGKTTILRMISGFMEPSAGRILIGGENMAGIGPNRRPTALIFQNLALFPMMTVADNIAFGLEMRGVDRSVRRKRAMELLELIALPDSADKRIEQLSGGQKQRVAIARALAVEPQVMLLDEPLSALDLKLRQHMRTELRAIQRRTGLTFIYITHDQGEALTMSDRVGVMSRGRIDQVGLSHAIYDEPATPFVATFVGENNVFAGRLAAVSGGVGTVETPTGPLRARVAGDLAPGASVLLFVRPERMRLGAGADGPNTVTRPVSHVDFEGNFVNVALEPIVEGGRPMLVQLSNDGRIPAFDRGAAVAVSFDPAHARILAAGEMAKE